MEIARHSDPTWGICSAWLFPPPMFLKAGSYSVSMTLGTPTKLIQELTAVVQFDVEENSVNPLDKGYRKERPGHVISPGAWEIRKLDSAKVVA